MAKDEKLLQRVEAMRTAAARLREADENLVLDKEFLGLVADMVDMEAATLGEITPFTELMDAVISNKTGGEARLVIARDDEGEMLFYTDNTTGASRIAEYINQK
jgi:hypothetical protein